MDYEQKYKEILEWARKNKARLNGLPIEEVLPELAENEDERIRKKMIEHFKSKTKDTWCNMPVKSILAWLEKQGRCDIDCPQKYQDNIQPNGCIVLENFNGGEGFYKLNLDYLNKKQVEEVEEMVRTWNKESKVSNENIKACVGMCLTDANEQRFKDYNTSLKDCLDYLEKQGEQKVSVDDFKAKDWYVSKVDGKIHNIYYSVDKVKPKFKVGDKIIEKNFDECGRGTIIDIKDGKYIFDDGGFICIEEQGLWKLVEQKPAEWSEEDELMRTAVIQTLERFGGRGTTGMQIDWLKSLRPSWKPSKEQMEALSDACCIAFEEERDFHPSLSRLYHDLRKL